MEETDFDTSVNKQDAAKMLGVSIRQVELRASRGEIRKRLLPKLPSERAARVVYSVEDIEAIKAGKPNGTIAAAAVPPARRDSVPWPDLIEQLAGIARAFPTAEHQTEQMDAMVAAISGAFNAERDANAERERAMMAQIDHFIELLAERQTAPAPESAPWGDLLAALARAFPAPAPVVRPWLTLREADAYSGLPAPYLLAQARAGAPFARNVGQGTRPRWRFNRDALCK